MSHGYLFDKRIIERNIKKGLVDRKDYSKMVENLPDLESEAVAIDMSRAEAAIAAGSVRHPTDTDEEDSDSPEAKGSRLAVVGSSSSGGNGQL